ncbi:hypothetical protein BD779DRAFT_1431059 [Infundibulicybe gibba]|nr:hypothetical protein BD779DRAFT_1431059 [Infundibulicybe gibba]
MNQLNPNLAIYYSFHTSSSSAITNSGDRLEMHLGSSAALEELLQRGCSFATKPWVDNHWCLILWKLAGMVALEPESEHSPVTKRWCWSEVIRQLLYRYERELNSGRRPALRLIVTQDAPAAYPIVLCISGISWSEASITDDGIPVEPHPELEVTDGWYRLRAQVDAPLARAIRRGIISIGRKIGVAGARLSSERKEPAEILESYNSSKLIISGNSSHLAPWHAKLGFRAGACISTLHSLTADGGVVAAMDLVVIKAYPVAFLEFLEDENGKKTREGPRSEADESVANERWRKRREVEASKLHSELDARVRKYEGYAERLEQRAGPHFRFGPDGPPDHIERLYDDLEEPSHASRLLGRLSQDDAGWLAKHIRNTIDKERDSAADGMELLLNDACPPRDVRSFRILVVQDARTCRRPSHRTAQLTVWDVLNLSLSEGTTPGTFTVGQRFLVCVPQ